LFAENNINRNVFGLLVCEIARNRKDMVCITAAMREGTGLAPFAKEFPKRFYDVGIAEGHGVTFAAGLASLPLDVIRRVLTPVLRVIVDKRINMMEFISFLSELSISFRRDGLFGLERVVNSRKVPYPGIKRAVQLAMEISDIKQIREVLEIEKKTYLEDIDNAINFMEILGTYAPAFGLLGTVIGLVYMLANLKDPSTIGQGLALALLTTFYGLIISNMIFTPLASRLRYLRSKEEVLLNLTEKAIIFMLDGLSPRIIRDSLVESLIGKNNSITIVSKQVNFICVFILK